MDDITDIRVVKFGKDNDPASHDPLTALIVAEKWIKDMKADHVIVIVGRTIDGTGSGTKYFQAGNYTHHAQLGLIMAGMELMSRDDG